MGNTPSAVDEERRKSLFGRTLEAAGAPPTSAGSSRPKVKAKKLTPAESILAAIHSQDAATARMVLAGLVASPALGSATSARKQQRLPTSLGRAISAAVVRRQSEASRRRRSVALAHVVNALLADGDALHYLGDHAVPRTAVEASAEAARFGQDGAAEAAVTCGNAGGAGGRAGGDAARSDLICPGCSFAAADAASLAVHFEHAHEDLGLGSDVDTVDGDDEQEGGKDDEEGDGHDNFGAAVGTGLGRAMLEMEASDSGDESCGGEASGEGALSLSTLPSPELPALASNGAARVGHASETSPRSQPGAMLRSNVAGEHARALVIFDIQHHSSNPARTGLRTSARARLSFICGIF